MSKNQVPWRVSRTNAFSRGEEGGTSRQHPDLRKDTAARMRSRGIGEIICRAFEATGLLVTKENWEGLPKAQQDEWNAATDAAREEIDRELERKVGET